MLLTASDALTSAPFETSKEIHSWCPLDAAAMTAVNPSCIITTAIGSYFQRRSQEPHMLHRLIHTLLHILLHVQQNISILGYMVHTVYHDATFVQATYFVSHVNIRTAR